MLERRERTRAVLGQGGRKEGQQARNIRIAKGNKLRKENGKIEAIRRREGKIGKEEMETKSKGEKGKR